MDFIDFSLLCDTDFQIIKAVFQNFQPLFSRGGHCAFLNRVYNAADAFPGFSQLRIQRKTESDEPSHDWAKNKPGRRRPSLFLWLVALLLVALESSYRTQENRPHVFVNPDFGYTTPKMLLPPANRDSLVPDSD